MEIIGIIDSILIKQDRDFSLLYLIFSRIKESVTPCLVAKGGRRVQARLLLYLLLVQPRNSKKGSKDHVDKRKYGKN